MKKIEVHFTHEQGGTVARAKMDAVPRVGDQVNIGTVSVISVSLYASRCQ